MQRREYSSKEGRSNIVQLTFIAMMTWHLIIDFLVPLKAEAKASLGFIISIAFQSACHPVEQMLMNVCKTNKWMNALILLAGGRKALGMCKNLQGA